MPRARGEQDEEEADCAKVTRRIQSKRSIRRARKGESRREWVLRKKERAKKRGVSVKADSKYSARRRRTPF